MSKRHGVHKTSAKHGYCSYLSYHVYHYRYIPPHHVCHWGTLTCSCLLTGLRGGHCCRPERLHLIRVVVLIWRFHHHCGMAELVPAPESAHRHRCDPFCWLNISRWSHMCWRFEVPASSCGTNCELSIHIKNQISDAMAGALPTCQVVVCSLKIVNVIYSPEKLFPVVVFPIVHTRIVLYRN